jgi:hypothetical protein
VPTAGRCIEYGRVGWNVHKFTAQGLIAALKSLEKGSVSG